VQERHARAFAAPLVSAGRIVVVPHTGLLWVLKDPFPITIALTPKQVIEREEGLPPRVTPAATQPVLQAMMGLLLDLPSGRTDALAGSFGATLEMERDAWRLHLTPTDPLLARVVTGIEVTGSRFIRHVLVREVSGDFTDVRFTSHTIAADGLSEQEARNFRE
jgi:hypothetical protein